MNEKSGQIRVLHFAGGMNAGGMETLIMSLYRKMDRNMIQFDFLYSVPGSFFYDDEIEALGGRIIRIPISRRRWRESKKEFLEYYAAHPYMVTHHHCGILKSVFGLSLCKQAGVPTRILHAHSVGAASHPGFRAKVDAVSHHLNSAARLSVATDYFACSQDAAKWFGFEKLSNYHIIANGVDIDRFGFDEGKRIRVRAELGLPHNTFCVGQIARFAPVKNHEFTLNVFARLIEFRPDSVLILVGTGPLVNAIRDTASAMGILDKVVFLGDRSDVDAILCALDVFLLPSIQEGLPLSLMEAQANGTACIVSRGVSGAAVACKNVHRINTVGNVREWVQILLGMQVGFRNQDASAEVARAGYDIRVTAKWLEEYYIERYVAGFERLRND